MDHGVRDPDCDHCKRALGPLYQHRIKGNRHLPVFTFDFSGPHPRRVNAVLPCLQASFEDLCALTGGSRLPIFRLHSDKAKEFLASVIRSYLAQQGVRRTVNSCYDPQGNGLAERWVGSIKVRATALLADVRLPPEYWS